jgi:predicted nucleic acid-binding protein
MVPTIYLETSIISYLAAQPSRDLITAARQQLTHEWWDRRRNAFQLFVSELVLVETSRGDVEAAARRLAWVDGIEVVDISPLAEDIADQILRHARLPQQARADALHIAIAAAQGLDYLMTWNATHIANALIRPRVERVCRSLGFEPPVLCTPDELMAGEEL